MFMGSRPIKEKKEKQGKIIYLLNRDLNLIETPNANRNLVQRAVLKIPRKFHLRENDQ